ncbi:aldo/keto reductase [Bacteroides reticulotermitis]|uniref:Reductase n=1 Tax=Bacteroides reticulotermitis JCM 10512 TaxID=1445607 RepID=W4UWS7_9BACE|nr:aldo/keto reductase [Bacteroides reticulotermitis]GAE84944.1 reductase [Bacteroides reticulotermitis JCM 10512]
MKQLKTTGSNVQLGISQLGLGAMRMAPDREGAISAIHAALDNGVNFLNTGDFYSSGISETIVGEALKGRKREDAFVSVKFGALQTIESGMSGFDVRPEGVENYLAYSLKRLGLDYIDLYQPAASIRIFRWRKPLAPFPVLLKRLCKNHRCFRSGCRHLAQSKCHASHQLGRSSLFFNEQAYRG